MFARFARQSLFYAGTAAACPLTLAGNEKRMLCRIALAEILAPQADLEHPVRTAETLASHSQNQRNEGRSNVLRAD